MHRIAWLIGFGFLLAFAPMIAHAQQWSGILSPSRATDWSSAGVLGGIPKRTTICATIAPYAGSAATINNAIAACPSGQVVQLQTGTFSLSTGLVFAKSNVTLRGAGAGSTKLIINGTTSGCSLFYNSAIRMCAGSGNIGTTAGGGPGPDHSATWTAGYAQGTTVITLSSTTGLAVGSTIFLDQLNDASDGYPATGDIFMCDGAQPCSWEGGNSFARDSRVQTEPHAITAINGSNVTISPGIMAPNFRASQSPGAWWGNSSVVIQNSGIEDMTVDFSSTGAVGLEMVNVTNSWSKGMRWIFNSGPGSFVFHVLIVNGFRITTRDSYFYGPAVQGNTQYSYTPMVSGSLLFENNILHHNVTPVAADDPETGSVYGYNYVDDAYYSPGPQPHNAGDILNLWEGNNLGSIFSDSIHGTHHFLTFFRNHFDGTAHNTNGVSTYAGLAFWSHNRFHNVIGNVLGSTAYTTYEVNLADCFNCVYNLGFQGSHGGTALGNDPHVKRTLMRWGNYDSVNNAVRFSSAEVPTDIPSYANPIPASQALPSSFYLPGRPSWWTTAYGTPPWPAIGADVTGGSLPSSGGRAYKIPARLCFENAPLDPAYPSTNPRIRSFDAGTCYAQAQQQSVPSAPGSPALQ